MGPAGGSSRRRTRPACQVRHDPGRCIPSLQQVRHVGASDGSGFHREAEFRYAVALGLGQFAAREDAYRDAVLSLASRNHKGVDALRHQFPPRAMCKRPGRGRLDIDEIVGLARLGLLDEKRLAATSTYRVL